MSVLSVAFSHDGKALASGSGDKTIKLWDVASGRELRTLAGHTDYVTSVAFSPDGHTLASGSGDKTIKLWDVASGRELRTLAGHTFSVESVAFSADGRTLASGSWETIKLWDPNSGRELRTLAAATSQVTSLAFSPDGRTLASGSDDKTVKLWDVTSGRELRTLAGHTDSVRCVAFSPDGHTLASGSADTKVKLWDVAGGRELRTLAGHTNRVGSVAFSPDGRTLASGSDDTTIRLWDVASGRELRTLAGHTNRVGSVAFGPDGRTLASGSDDTTIKLWDVASGRELRTLVGHGKPVGFVVFSPEGHSLAVRSADHTLKLWDMASGHELGTLKGDTGSGASVVLTPDGHLLSWHYEIQQYTGGSGGEQLTLVAGRVGSVAFSPDGRTLASGSSLGATIKLWDVASGGELRTLAGHRDTVWSVAFSPDGRTLASGSWDGTIKLWDAASGRELRTLAGHTDRVEFVAFSPDGHTLASGSDDKTVKLWDVTSGRERRTLAEPDGWVLAFSPDGRTLASATIKLWDVATGRELRTLAGHTQQVQFVAFSANGRTLTSRSEDNTMKRWDVASGRELRTVGGPTGLDLAQSAAISRDGRVVASGYYNGTVQLWDAATGNELAALFALDQSDWVVSDPEGRFDTSNLDEIKGLSWVFPDEPLRALPPEIFMRDYYEPRLLPKLLAAAKLRKVGSLLRLNRAQPVVNAVKVEPEAGRDLVSVTVQVTSTQSAVQMDSGGRLLQSGAYDLHLFRSGQLVGRWPEISESAEKASGAAGSQTALESWRKLHEIELFNGEYTHTFRHIRLPRRAGVNKVQFTAYAFNSDRVKSPTTPPLEYSLPKASVSTPAVIARRAYLISMGVNANQSRWNLDFAVASAQDAARLLREKLARDYEVIDISLFSTLAPDSPRVLLQQATKANLKAVLDLLAGKAVDSALRDAVDPDHKLQPATPDDAVVLFLSSHGYAGPEGTFYVVPYDTGAAPGVTEDLLTRCQAHPEDRSPACEKANAFLEHAISSQEFTAWWAGVDAGEMVMILDACHSAAAPGREFRPGPLGDAGFGQLSYDKGMRTLTATQPDKTARATLVQELGHSLLVQALLEEAKTHPQETLAEWLHDTEQQVPVLTHRLYPELSEADLQLPELFDFAVMERHQTQSRSADVSR